MHQFWNKEKLHESLQRADFAASVELPVDQFRELVEIALSAAPPVTGGAWLPIDPEMKDTWPPHDQKVLLFHWYNGQPVIEIDCYSQGRIGMRSYHSWATHWQPLPAPPSSQTRGG